MSKYIIEIKPEYEDKFKGVMILGAENSNLYVDSNTVDELEELTADYINENFGDLQDEAYQKGFEDGKKEAESSDHIKNVEMDAFNKGMLFKEEKIHEAYQRGLEDGKAVNDKGCEGCLYNDGTKEHSPCDICCNAYLNRWTAKPQEDDKIEVGDEVEWTGDKYIVTYINYNIDTSEITDYDLLGEDGSVAEHVKKCAFVKTGRHFDIASILEEMKHD